MKNQRLYEITHQEKWSKKVKRRRLVWYGHLVRLPIDSPAKIALLEALRKVKRPVGRPKTTWISKIKSDLNGLLNIYCKIETHPAHNRIRWREIVECAMSRDEKRV